MKSQFLSPSFLRKLKLWLHIDAPAYGLEISDHVLQLCHFDELVPQVTVVRLSPGIIDRGRVVDRAAFVAALQELKESAFGRRGRSMNVNIVATLSSADIYNQFFNLPVIQGENLDKAVALNLQMAAPSGDAGSYSGWQIVRKDTDQSRYEIASAFVERTVVDDLVSVLHENGFVVVALESKALSLARVLAQQGNGFDVAAAYLMVWVDDTGIDLLVLRSGRLYFEYMNPWRDLVDEKGEISGEAFETAVVKNLRQITNFYGQHWSDPVKAVIVGPDSVYDRTAPIVSTTLGRMVVPFSTLTAQGALSPDSCVALGAAIRGLDIVANREEINLLGSDADVAFQEERLLGFMRFWRTVLPLTLILLIGLLTAADFFLANTNRTLAMSSTSISGATSKELEDLTSQANTFNHEVALVQSAETAPGSSRGDFIQTIMAVAAANNITISDMKFTTPSEPVLMAGNASTQNDVVLFKKALSETPGVTNVDVPLSGIQPANGGFFFSLTFSYAFP